MLVDSNARAAVDWESLEGWLKELYAPSLPPLVSKSSAMQQQLSGLYALDGTRREVERVVDAVQQEAVREYTALSAHTAQVLQVAGLSPSSLPQTTANALAELSRLASDLGLADMRTESYERAVALDTMAAFRRTSEQESLQTQTDAIHERIRASQRRQQHLRKLLEARSTDALVEEQKAREWERNASVVAQKAGEYRTRLTELERVIAERRAYEHGLEYQQISELDLKVREASERAEQARNACDGYSALPPDIPLAYVKLEEARQNLERLRSECEDAAEAAFSAH
ncbi:hypothetical protein GGF46_003714 [Coemansia sp. RSA 552]|nr:hypothetical protein GGF46_003714 [Coemansia sp. RSA 552]